MKYISEILDTILALLLGLALVITFDNPVFAQGGSWTGTWTGRR